MAGRETGTFSTFVSRPTEKKGLSARAAGGLLLTLICPPLGLIYLWRNGVFRARGRVLVTALAAVEMALLFSLIMPKAQTTLVLPPAMIPSSVTSAPVNDVANALSNLEALLSDNYATPSPQQLTAEERAAQEAQEKAELDYLLDNTIVYSVYNGARFYHSVRNCGQVNNKEMTLREALAAKLGACNVCNPPYVS